MAQRAAAVIVAASAGLVVAITLWRRRQLQKAAAAQTPGAPSAVPPPKSPAEKPLEIEVPAEERRVSAQKAKELGNKRFAGKQFEKAIEEYSKAIELAPDKKHKEVAVFYGNRSQCYAMLEQHEKAEQDSDLAVSIDPKYVKAICRRAMAREHLGKLEQAFQDLTAACLLSNFENELAKTGTERVLKQLATRKAEAQLQKPMRKLPSASFIATFVDSFKRYRELLATPRRSIAEFNVAAKSVSAGAARAALLSERALAFMAARKYEEAMTDWSEALASIPPPATATGACWPKGAAATSQETLREWMQASQSGVAVVGPPLALSMAGMFLHLRGNYQDAMECYDYALELEPRCVETLLKRASLWFEKDEMPRAMADFETAIAADASHPDTHCHRGQLYILQNELGKALADLRKAVALDPGSVLARIQLGMALHRNQQQSEAQRVFQDAEESFPRSPDVLNYHGELLVEANQFELAKSKFNAALEASDNGFALAHVNLGVLQLHAHQDIAAAMHHCEQAVAVDPLCETAHVHMAHLHLQKLELEKAIQAYDRAVGLLRMKQELVDCFSMREATAAQLALLTSQPDVYGPVMAAARCAGS